MSILVTGASGFIGSRVLEQGDRALVRKSIGWSNEVIGDLRELRSLETACTGIETIFHCAGDAHAFSSGTKRDYWAVNFKGTKNLLLAARRSGVKKFVFLSSVKAMAEPLHKCVDENWPVEPVTEYGQSKRAAEVEVLKAGKEFDMHVVILRLAMVYGSGGQGNLERMARAIRARWFPAIPDTGNKRSLIHVQDVVDVMRLVSSRLEANGQIYIISDQYHYSGRQLYDAIRALLIDRGCIGKHMFEVPEFVLRVGGYIGDFFSVLTRYRMPFNSEVVDRLLGSACYSSSLIKQELGWSPRINLELGLREMLFDETIP
jgi:UDP-glucose 4-epimerase